jgi:hypothetical protein
VIRLMPRSAAVFLCAVVLVAGLMGQARAVADEGRQAEGPVFQVAGYGFDTYDDDHRRYRCYDRYSYDGYYYDSYYYDGYYGSYDRGYYHPYDHRYRDGCRRYYGDRYHYDRDRGDHDGDRDFPDRRRGRNHDDD